MMSAYESVFYNILKSSLWGTPAEVPQGFNEWGKVFVLAKSQAVLGLVANYVLGDEEIAQKMPEDAQKRLKSFMMANVMTHSGLNNTLIRVVSLLNEAGIGSVLLKGQGLARNYPIPELRQCGDIDLYVGDENAERVYELLKPIATEIDDQSEIHVTKHFHVHVGTVIIEAHRFADIHSSSTFNRIYQDYAAAGLTQNLVPLDFAGVTVNTPSNNFNAFYVFNHLWHHFMTSGVGLRQLCDWMMFLHSHHGQLDLVYLAEVLDKMDLMKPWKVFGCILVDTLGMPSQEFPFYDTGYSSKGKKALDRILKEGNFGRNTAYMRKRKGNYFAEKWFSFKCHVSRYIGLFRVFPCHAIRQFWYMLSAGIKAVWKDKVQ